MDNAVAKKFGRKKQLKSKAVPIYPKSAEREMQRIVNAYMAEVIKYLRATAYGMMRADAWGMDKRQLDKLAERVGLENRLRKVGYQVESQSFREWKKCVKETLGVDLPESYYVGGIYEPDVNKWLLEMMKKMRELPGNTQAAVQKVIAQCVKKGKTVTEMRKAVDKKLASAKRMARLSAVATIAALFGVLNRLQQSDAGCKKYYWKTARDNRVRPCHRALDGHIFEWDNPPEMWRETKHGIVYTGMRCNPGEDYGCRCVAIRVFEIDWLTLPNDERKGKNG